MNKIHKLPYSLSKVSKIKQVFLNIQSQVRYIKVSLHSILKTYKNNLIWYISGLSPLLNISECRRLSSSSHGFFNICSFTDDTTLNTLVLKSLISLNLDLITLDFTCPRRKKSSGVTSAVRRSRWPGMGPSFPINRCRNCSSRYARTSSPVYLKDYVMLQIIQLRYNVFGD